MSAWAVRGKLAIAGSLVDGAVVIEEERIIAVTTADRDGDLPRLVLDAPIVAPGFIDLQVNGGFGAEIDSDPESHRLIASRLPASGVTSFLPTVISSRPEVYPPIFRAFGESKGINGARALGLHLEGPLLSPVRKGAHPLDAIESAPDSLFDAFLSHRETLLITLAPERPGNLERIERLRKRGIVASLGHTNATLAELTAGVDAGATMATHLFNAMSPFGHREPGAIGAVLTDDRLTAGLIADGVHVHPRAIELAVRAKGIERVALVTDMMAAAGMPPGRYRLGEQRVITDGVSARLEDGTLAGAVLPMNRAVWNLIQWAGVPVARAIRTATESPAQVLDRRDLGFLRAGALADLVLLDGELNPTLTIVGGEIVYRRA